MGPDLHSRLPSLIRSPIDDGRGAARGTYISPIVSRQFGSGPDDGKSRPILDELHGGRKLGEAAGAKNGSATR